MTMPENPPNSEETIPPETGIHPEEALLPEGFSPIEEPLNLSHVRRRRRTRRYFVTPNEDERSALVEKLAKRAFPSFEFFLFALLSGAIMGAGYILDSNALLLLGVLLAPLMTPWVGMVLGAMTGSWRFFFQTLIALLAGCLLVFLTGTLAGLAGQIFPGMTLFQANILSHLWWENLFVLVLGSILLVYSFTASDDKPILPNVLLAYGLLLPLSAAGFGLGSGAPQIWPDGLLVFIAHLALVTLMGGIVLALLHFKPAQPAGSALTVLVGLACLAGLITLTGMGNSIFGAGSSISPRRQTPTAASPTVRTPTPGILLPSLTSSPEQSPTPMPSETPSLLPSPTVPPAYAVIAAEVGGGALLRSEPGGNGVKQDILENGVVVQVLPEIQKVGNSNWVKVRTLNGVEGWVLQTVLKATAPPPPTYTPNQ